jgi:hypothetical protein
MLTGVKRNVIYSGILITVSVEVYVLHNSSHCVDCMKCVEFTDKIYVMRVYVACFK